MTAFKIEIDHAKLQSKIKKGCELAEKAVAEQIINDSDQFVPRLEGDLRSFTRPITEGGNTFVVYDSPYALYQWFGVRADGTHAVAKYTTPGTGTQWILKAEERYRNDWLKIAQKEFAKGVGK